MTARRLAVLALAVATAALAVLVLTGGDSGYLVRSEFEGVGGLREGSKVQVDGVPVGKVEKIELGRSDHAMVEARIEDSAGPLGDGSRATVRAANLLGEKYLDLERGDVRRPQRPEASVPLAQTGVAVELDDVLNSLDLPTRAALQVVINESGTALSNRGLDLGAMLDAMPNALDRTGRLLDEFAADNRALGRLVERGDRVTASVSRERASLGRLVDGTAVTLDALASRRRELGDTVRRAPGTLRSLRRALSALDRAALPLGPAARGLRVTAPRLTATLKELPPFMRSARPTLRTARRVAPRLTRLGRRGTPLVRRVRPVVRELRDFGREMQPITRALDTGIYDTLGVLEGWARSTAPSDAAGHVFRAGFTIGSDLFKVLLEGTPPLRNRPRAAAQAARRPASPGRPGATDARRPGPRLESLSELGVRLPKPQAGDELSQVLDYLLGP